MMKGHVIEPLFLFLFFCLLTGGGGNYEMLFEKCCDLGRKWGEQNTDCEKYFVPLNGISLQQQIPCLVTVEICCLRYHRFSLCNSGKEIAINGRDCKHDVHPVTNIRISGVDFRKDCCDACKLGLITGSHGYSCILKEFAFDYPWDEAFADCCELGKSSYGTGYLLNTDIDGHSDINDVEGTDRCETNNPCQHHCKDTGVAIECSCIPGFQLAFDQKSCIDIDECSTNQHSCDLKTQHCTNTEGGFLCFNEDGHLNTGESSQNFGSLPSHTTFSPVDQPANNPFTGMCTEGFAFNPISRVCSDVDECEIIPPKCNPMLSFCQNTIGSFTCVERFIKKCPPGYQFNPTIMSCVDIDECAEGKDLCNRHREFCLNTIGGYECQPRNKIKCPAGYKYNTNEKHCNDVDECKENLHTCDNKRENCRNTVGGYECDPQCEKGYRYSLSWRTCLDIDECEEKLDECNPVIEDCINTNGDYECYPKSISTICPAGYKPGVNNKCVDVDECEENLDSCDKLTETCVNDDGRYHCKFNDETNECDDGFKFDPIQQQCTDIDECAEGLHDCDSYQSMCSNTQGGFHCIMTSCPHGFRMNISSHICEDINECAENLHNCSYQTSECINIDGGFHCRQLVSRTCLPGHYFNTYQQTCEDINECLEGQSTCDTETETCVNNIGSYMCLKISCPPGHKPNVTFRVCTDIDECEENLHNCSSQHETCKNTIGGFLCTASENASCPTGHRFNKDTQRCEDVNECQEATHTCSSERREVCLNTVGSFLCQVLNCPVGFRPNILARTCVDINECEETIHSCSQHETCVNSIGSFQCHPIERQQSCPEGFRINIRSSTCTDIDECFEGLSSCNLKQERCINEEGSYRCESLHECQPGFQYNSDKVKCEDVDECINGQHNCQLQIQNCVNTFGSFQCVTKPELSCSKGMRYNRNSNQCEDYDECAEQTDSCDRITHNCINTVGSFRCAVKPVECPSGYRLDTSSNDCIDMNECLEGLHDCNNRQYCINTLGAYECRAKEAPMLQCEVGFRFNADKNGCEDVDECHENLHNCNEREECRNVNGSFECIPIPTPSIQTIIGNRTCQTGYHYNPRSRTCVDIDECLENLHNCHPSAELCVNLAGTFHCQIKPRRWPQPTQRPHHAYCPPGFTFNEYYRQCQDINECQLGTHNCVSSQRCDNTIGSFTCIRTTGCGTGYTLNQGTGQCEDDNECEIGNHNCGQLYDCHNLIGSFRCYPKICPLSMRLDENGVCTSVVCETGFEPDSSGTCVDVNECLLQTNLCPQHQECINNIGSYKCESSSRCGEGYELDEQELNCIDIDECARGIHECRGGQKCINRPGHYACQCFPGYTMNANNECEDIDECARYRRLCTENGECRNTQGSYICDCKQGFKQTEDGKTCIDVDECEQQYICHQKCINTWGSYKCACDQGYTLDADGRSCQDIDECSLWKGRGNLCLGICVNEPGSYSCQCPQGYRLDADKRTCQDNDECAQGNVCTGQNEVCLNTRGSYRCNTIICPHNYIRDKEHRNRCKRESRYCPQGDLKCLQTPLSISYNYITFVSNMRIPSSGQLDLFTMRGPLWSTTTVQFTLELTSARAPTGIAAATRQYFRLRRTAFNQAVISLTRSIPGPQEIELELTMKLYSNNNYGGEAVAKIFLYVSQYEY